MSRKVIKLNALPLMQTRKRVAAYARVSSVKDEMLHSLAAQVEYYRNLIQVHPEWEYAGVYADEAYTGTKGDRPEFTQMLSACRTGKIDMIVTKSISRFARNTVTLLETVRELKTLDVDVFFEEQNLHSASADGELMLTILASYAQEESLSASENCKWRIRNEFKKGNPSCGLMIYGYDYRDGKLVINPQEAEVVQMIYADYLSGMGRNAIMRKLDQLGIPTKQGSCWAVNTIVSILTNEKLTGDMCLQKYYVTNHLTKQKIRNNGQLPQYYVEGSHEGIIDADLPEQRAAAHLHTVAQANGLDGRHRQHSAGQHRHGIRIVQKPGVGANFFHITGKVQHNGNRTQSTEHAAYAQRIRDRLS